MNRTFLTKWFWKTILFSFASTSLLLLSMNTKIFAHGWKAPEDAAKKPNPVESTLESVEQGRETYLDVCSNCHGKYLKGGDPDRFKGRMVPPNLIQRLKHHSDGDFFWKIQNGKGDMPAFKEDLKPSEIWNIINFIKTQE